MVRLVLFCWAFCSSFARIWLVRMEMKENSRPVSAETMGIRKRPTLSQLRPYSQNFSWGTWDRSRPRKLKLIEKMLAPASPTAAWTVARFSGVMREERNSWS